VLDVMILRSKGDVVAKYIVTENNNLLSVRHNPYFYVNKKTRLPDKNVVGVFPTNKVFYVFNEGKYRYEPKDVGYRVEVEQPRDVKIVAKKLQDLGYRISMANIRYEAKVSLDFSDTLLGVKIPLPIHYEISDVEDKIHTLIERMKKIKILGFDIEVKAEGSFPRLGEKVFLITYCYKSLFSNEIKCEYLEEENTYTFINKVLKIKPNYIIGFNSLGFDIPYLKAYLKEYADQLHNVGIIQGNIGIPHVDVQQVLYNHPSAFGLPLGSRLALDDIALKMGVANEKDIEIESSIDRNRIYIVYKNNPEKVIKYGLTDARLTTLIGEKVMKVLLILYAISGISPSVVQKLPTLGSLSEYAICNILEKRDNIVLEMRDTKYTAKELDDAIGFYKSHTKESFTSSALYTKVLYVDYHMLYPTIYYTYKTDPIGVRIGKGFKIYLVPRNSKPSVKTSKELLVSFEGGKVYNILKYFYTLRGISKKLKKEGIVEPDQAVKILVNSAYGLFSKSRGNGVNEVLGSFIFYKSNQILVNTIGIVETLLDRKVVYTATDSLFIKMKEGDNPGKLVEELNKYIRLRIGENFVVKKETVCKQLVLLKRKTYICNSDEETIVKGMEKLQIPRAIKDNLDEIFKAELEHGKGEEKLEELLKTSDTRELFVKTSKNIAELYSSEERRFKQPTSNQWKAALVRYLYDMGAENYVVEFTLDTLDEQTVITWWLKYRNGILIYIDDDKQLYARLVEYYNDKNRMYAVFDVKELRLSREEIEKLARKQSKVIYDYLNLIKSLKQQKTLDRWY